MDRAVGISHDDRFLSVTSVSFDISVVEMLWPLARGASTVICPERMVERLSSGANSLEAMIRRFGPSLFQATPSFFSALASEATALESLGGLRALLVGGEALTRGLASRLADALPRARMLNMYGPTETTIWSTAHELDSANAYVSTIPIGRPIANTRLRIVDRLGNDACVGVAGELWIGGTGVARGYFRRPDLDEERFVRLSEGTAVRYYRTGDVVRWRDDGELDFLGRNDRQVKLLGHRVELDEIESVLSEHPRVASAAVVLSSHPERGDELIAYLVPHGGRDRAARQHLDGWRIVGDAWYGGHRRAESPFVGRLDSYTGKRFSEAVMRQWLDAWVERVRRLAPRRIVDVGAGAGLLLHSLPSRCDRYLVIDPSAAALDTAKVALDASGGSADVEFRVGDAGVLRELADASADVVVLNSVVQYFPDAAYLTTVLDEAIRVVGPGGAVLVGDVRDLRLLQMLYADVELHRAAPLTPATRLRARVDRLGEEERELCLTPSFFEGFAARHAGCTVRMES
jgi:acyl-CoA synthetase (AMP-forming)/AMP-acid ligase II